MLIGPYCISPDEALKLYEYSAKDIRQTGLIIRLKSFEVINDPCPYYGLNDFALRYWCQYDWLRKNRRQNVLHHMISPVHYDQGKSWLAGIAQGVCTWHRGKKRYWTISYSSAIEERQPDGSPRLSVSGLIMTHELGHIIGARHIKSRTIMHPDAGNLYLQRGNLKWDRESIKQIKQCTRQ